MADFKAMAKEDDYFHVEILALATHHQTESIQYFVIDLVARYGTSTVHPMTVCHFVPCGLVRRQGSSILTFTTPTENGPQPDCSTMLPRATAFHRTASKWTSPQPPDDGCRHTCFQSANATSLIPRFPSLSHRSCAKRHSMLF